ncbi:MAG: hypothetical protein LBU35_00110 [Holosporales bacterium]|jgi:hypothetical protein|nr:hypothetical protein [Holosporales bacterium]
MNAHSLGAVAQYVQAMDDVTDADLEAFLDIAYLVAPLAIGNLFIPPNHPQSFTALDLFGATINAYNHGHGRLGASGMNHVHWNNAYMPL